MHDDKKSNTQEADNHLHPLPPVRGGKCDSDADNIVLPTFELPPYTKKDGIEFYSATQVARILHVKRQTVLHWRKKGIFNEDFVKHGVYLYSGERVEQLKSVYHKDWTWGGYMPSPTCTGQFTSIHTPPPLFTPVNDKQNRIAELIHFFEQLYGKIPEPHFAYLWTKQQGIYSFTINDETQREVMAKKAVELSDCNVDIWHSVNTVCVKPSVGKRGTEEVVSYQTAIIVDIDIRSDVTKATLLFLPLTSMKPNLSCPLRPRLLSIQATDFTHTGCIMEKWTRKGYLYATKEV